MKNEVTSAAVLVSDKGGTLECISAEGERLFAIAVPAGRVRASLYTDLVPEGANLQVGDGLVAFHPRSGLTIQRPDLVELGGEMVDQMYQTGANPDYAPPTSADKMARQLRLSIDRLAANNDAAERRLRALETIERIPKAPEPEPDLEVIEAPAPAPKPKKEAAKPDDE